MLANDARRQVSSIERLESVADKILNTVEAYIDARDPTEIDTMNMRHITGVLRDIKEIMRGRKDLDEQDARIAKLRREAERTTDNESVTIVLEGDVEQYAQ